MAVCYRFPWFPLRRGKSRQRCLERSSDLIQARNDPRRENVATTSTGNTKNLVSAMTNKSDLLRHDPINVMYCDLSRYLYRNGRKHGEMFCLRPLQTVWQSIKLLSPRTIPPRASLSAWDSTTSHFSPILIRESLKLSFNITGWWFSTIENSSIKITTKSEPRNCLSLAAS